MYRHLATQHVVHIRYINLIDQLAISMKEISATLLNNPAGHHLSKEGPIIGSIFQKTKTLKLATSKNKYLQSWCYNDTIGTLALPQFLLHHSNTSALDVYYTKLLAFSLLP